MAPRVEAHITDRLYEVEQTATLRYGRRFRYVLTEDYLRQLGEYSGAWSRSNGRPRQVLGRPYRIESGPVACRAEALPPIPRAVLFRRRLRWAAPRVWAALRGRATHS
jgi:hypothetical protein